MNPSLKSLPKLSVIALLTFAAVVVGVGFIATQPKAAAKTPSKNVRFIIFFPSDVSKSDSYTSKIKSAAENIRNHYGTQVGTTFTQPTVSVEQGDQNTSYYYTCHQSGGCPLSGYGGAKYQETANAYYNFYSKYNDEAYNTQILMVPSAPSGSCGPGVTSKYFGVVAGLGSCSSGSTNYLETLSAHELGHGFGLGHAGKKLMHIDHCDNASLSNCPLDVSSQRKTLANSPWFGLADYKKLSGGNNNTTPKNPSTGTKPKPTPAKDVTPPSVPSGLRAIANTQNSVTIGWNPSSDNVGVYGYEVYRNGSFVCKTKRIGAVDKGSPTCSTFKPKVGGVQIAYTNPKLSPNTSYKYTINAYDKANNHSARTGQVSGSTRYSAPTGTVTSLQNGNFTGTANILTDWLQPYQVRDVGKWHIPANGVSLNCRGDSCVSYRNDAKRDTWFTQLINLPSYDQKYLAYARFELLQNEKDKARSQHPQALCIDFLNSSFNSLEGSSCSYAIYKNGRQTITTRYISPPESARYVRLYFGSNNIYPESDVTKYRWWVKNVEIRTKNNPVPGCKQCAE